MWRFIRIPVYVIGALFAALVILGIFSIPHYLEKTKTQETIDKIHAQKLTLKDVMGENLPPEPAPSLKDATVAGVDANFNGIRDDVELAIFKLHPESAKIRAAELQYAMALQNELNNVFNSETLVAVLWEESRGYFCLNSTIPDATDAVFNSTIKETKDLVFNSELRKNKSEEIFTKYMTSHANPSDQFCARPCAKR
jgi:hypothetical protein